MVTRRCVAALPLAIQQRPEMDKVTALLDEAEQFYLASLPEFGAEPPLVA